MSTPVSTPWDTAAGDIVCWDLDSTLADTRHRRERCPRPDNDYTWDDYATTCFDDEPVAGALRLMWILSGSGLVHHVISNRAASAYESTLRWLAHHQFPPVHTLTLRPPGLGVSGDEHKINHIRVLQRAGGRIALMVEDWPESATVIQAATGVPVLNVAGWYVTNTDPARPVKTLP